MTIPSNDNELEREKVVLLREILESQKRCEAKLDKILARLDVIGRALGEEPSAAAKQIEALKKQLGIGS